MAQNTHYCSYQYIKGFVLCLGLTIIPFVMVGLGDVFPIDIKIMVIAASAIAQLVVQLIYFMHIKAGNEPWNIPAFVFMLVIMVIVVGGSLWIMYNLNINMMPPMGS